jgi:hypothetical protein
MVEITMLGTSDIYAANEPKPIDVPVLVDDLKVHQGGILPPVVISPKPTEPKKEEKEIVSIAPKIDHATLAIFSIVLIVLIVAVYKTIRG